MLFSSAERGTRKDSLLLIYVGSRLGKMTIQKMMLLTALALSLYVQGSLAFAPSAAIGRWTNVPSVEASGLAALGFDDVDDSTRTVGRRDALSKMTSLLLMTTILGYSTPTYADVSDGNALPEGAAQFSRVVRAKSDMIVSSTPGLVSGIVLAWMPSFNLFHSVHYTAGRVKASVPRSQ